MLNFTILEMRYGAGYAYHLLQEIEKAAHIASAEIEHFDPEARLSNALRIQNAVLYRGYREAAMQMAA